MQELEGEEKAAFALLIMNVSTLVVLPFLWLAIYLISKHYSKAKESTPERASLLAQQIVWKYSLVPGLALVVFFIPPAFEYLSIIYVCYALLGIPNAVYVLMPYTFLEACLRNRRIGTMI